MCVFKVENIHFLDLVKFVAHTVEILCVILQHKTQFSDQPVYRSSIPCFMMLFAIHDNSKFVH